MAELLNIGNSGCFSTETRPRVLIFVCGFIRKAFECETYRNANAVLFHFYA